MREENSKMPELCGLTKSDVDVVEKQTVFQGFFKVDEYQLKHRLMSGGYSEVLTREVFERGNAVGILLYDPVLDCIVLIEQFRMGVLASDRDQSPWILEIVAGMLDKNMPAEEVARLEAQEEALCEVKTLQPICDYYVSPGGTSEHVSLFFAEVDASGVHGQIAGLDSEGEDIKVHLVPAADIQNVLSSGAANNGATIICLQWFLLHKVKPVSITD